MFSRSFFILLFFCLAGLSLKSIPSNLLKSNILVREGSVYYFGMEEQAKKLLFKCFRYNSELTLLDSFSLDIGPGKAEQYHEVGVDTLHRFLNFWFQEKNNESKAKYLRLDPRLKQIFFNAEAEVNRINTQFIYDDDKIYFRNRVYCIRSPRDSAHKFFLSCYELKTAESFFDYEIKWGFRFYKFNYLRCKLLMADDEKVLVYVHALDGEKKGQYILSISAKNGELLNSAQFNDEEEKFPLSYFYSSHASNPPASEFFAAGVTTRTGEEASLLQPKKPPGLFVIILNELAEVKYRFNDVAALPAPAMKASKFLCVRVKKINITENGLCEIISEVCGSADGKKFKPNGYWLVSFTYTAGIKTVTANEYFDLINNPANKLVTKQPSDINGLVHISTASENDKTLYMDHLNEIVISCKAEEKALKMIVRKKDLNQKKIIFSELSFKNGKMELKHLYDGGMDEMPFCQPIDNYNAIIFSKSKTQGLVFRKVAW
jgi:hypothetical protein